MATRNFHDHSFRPRTFFRNSTEECEVTPTRTTAGTISMTSHLSRSRTAANSVTSYSPGMVLNDIANSGSVSEDDLDFSFNHDDEIDYCPNTSNTTMSTSTPRPSIQNHHNSTPIFPRAGDTSSSTNQSFDDSCVGTLVGMLQQQQVVLQKLMDGQKALEEQQTTLKESVTVLQDKVNEFSNSRDSSNSSNSGGEGKRKRIVTRAISVRLQLTLVSI